MIVGIFGKISIYILLWVKKALTMSYAKNLDPLEELNVLEIRVKKLSL